MKNLIRNILLKIGGQNLRFSETWTFTLTDINTGKKRIYHYKNLIPTVGRQAIAEHLTDPTPTFSSLFVNFTALGTGVTAPANGNTQLQTETFRKNTASATFAANVAFITAFYTAPEITGTFKEAGLFMNATITANSGTLFSRVAIDITKSATETLTIDYTVTIV